MPNLFDYLESAQPSFDERPLSDIDSAALSAFCMVDVEFAAPSLPEKPNIVQRAARSIVPSAFQSSFRDYLKAEKFDGMFFGPNAEGTKRILYGLAASPRFRELRIGDGQTAFDEESHLQFAAMTFTLPGRFCYVGFRGTDRTTTGWREDFDMALQDEIPAQAAAARYLETVATTHREPLYVGGHSKGGNLAVVAALRASQATKDRIEAVFSHDGPGLRPGTFDAKAYEELSLKIRKTVPQDSLIGLLFEPRAQREAVVSFARGIEQHDLTTWTVDMDAESGPDFLRTTVSDSALRVAGMLNAWIEEAPREDIEAIIEALFSVLEDPETNAKFPEAFSDPKILAAFLKNAANAEDDRARKALVRAIGHFAASAASAIGESFLRKSDANR